jgi:nicotinamidase/pyrazinamidase
MDIDGALYVPDAESIKPNLKRLTDYARQNSIQVVGSVDRHIGTEDYKEFEGELQRNGGPFPDHCMHWTKGLEKIPETIQYPFFTRPDFGNEFGFLDSLFIFNTSLSYGKDNSVDDARNETYQRWVKEDEIKYLTDALHIVQNGTKRGIYFEKQSYDVFSNPNVEPFLRKAEISSAFVYGVATDFCVKAAVLGMQRLGIQTYVVTDAIRGVFPESTQKALEEMTQAGARFVTTDDVLENKIQEAIKCQR